MSLSASVVGCLFGRHGRSLVIRHSGSFWLSPPREGTLAETQPQLLCSKGNNVRNGPEQARYRSVHCAACVLGRLSLIPCLAISVRGASGKAHIAALQEVWRFTLKWTVQPSYWSEVP